MKMKLLDLALIAALYGMTSVGQAQEMAGDIGVAPTADPAPADIDCGDGACFSGDGLLFRVHTRSDDQPASRGTDAASSAQALQPDRRATVAVQPPGRAEVTGRFSVQLPGGGVVWATEDPDLGQPELSVSAPTMVAFDGRAIVRPVDFFVRGNYPAFIDRMELVLFRAGDADLIDPVARVPVDVAAAVRTEWDGTLPAGHRFQPGDELVYVLRAYDAEGHVDETVPQRMQLVRPEQAERGALRLRENAGKTLGIAMDADTALERSLVDRAFRGNGLRQQNIPVHGSRVRIQGRNLPRGQDLRINGNRYPVDMERKFVAEYLVPVGSHRFEIAVGGDGARPAARYALDIEVTGRYFFGVGIADVTFHQDSASGPGRSLAAADRDEDILTDGRLAFYLKAKLGGKYLVTAQADTRERPLEDLFDGFTEADARDVFRRLDPDLYYPTYGDDSRTWRDVDTMGRFFLRAEWDRSEALWGNFSTGFTGTEYGQYVRSLYGAALNWRSRATNAWGDPTTLLRVFASEAETAPGHSEFIGTGGSLYYLRHTDVLPGSDHVVLEVRDPATGRVEERTELVRGADYEIDELQGRVLLSRPLAQLTLRNRSSITRDQPLDGLEQRLIVDYEWVPDGFDADEIAAGLRGKHWFGDHLGVGLTRVDENRAGDDYTLTAADVTLRAGNGTYLKLEHGRTEATGAPVFFSDNGGLGFTRLNPAGPREGEATAVEVRANFRELGWTANDWSASAWWRQVDAGYSVARSDTGAAIEEYGSEVLGQLGADLGLYARFSRAERAGEALTQAQATLEWRLGDAEALTAEVRRVEEERAAAEAAGLLGALRYSRRIGTALDVYGTAQLTLDDDGGRYADNDALSVGGTYNFANLSSVGAELSSGDRGDAAQVNAEYRLSPQRSLYGSYTYSTDRSDYDPLFNPRARNGWTLGQRWRLSNQVNLFNESQFLEDRGATGLAHTFGMDFYPAQGWNTGFTLSDGQLVNAGGGQVDRRAVSVHGGRTSPATEWQSKLEWRRDTGAEQRTQWVSTNRLSHQVDESWRVAARLNYADTDDGLQPAAGAKFIEGNLGFAYRPWDNTRWGLFGRYTYLYDLATLGQVGGADYDQKTQVLSLEGVYRLDANWELAAKLARREGEMRHGRGSGAWFDSATTFVAGQVRYELLQRWHALAEYRWLDVDDGGTRRGWLVGVDRDINRHFRVGVGYNFTDFSDDLTDFDYDHRGWFVNITGSY